MNNRLIKKVSVMGRRAPFVIWYGIRVFFFFLFHRIKTTTVSVGELAPPALDGISIIIPTWNKADLLERCLKNIKIAAKELQIPIEIIVVDNASSDDTKKILQQARNLSLKVISFTENKGFAKAANEGARAARYSYLLFLNNDMFISKDSLSALVNCAQVFIAKKEPFFGLSMQILFADQRKRREESGKTSWDYIGGNLDVRHVVHPSLLNDISPTAYLGGGSSLIRADWFSRLNGFDAEAYTPLYVEDLDLSFRAWQAGLVSYFCPQSVAIHNHQSSSKVLSKDPTFYMHKNWVVFVLKHITSPALIAKHLLGYMAMMMFSERQFQIGKQVLQELPVIARKRKEKRYTSQHIDVAELLDFSRYEYEHF